MTNKELQALRKLFFLSTTEAAEHIGGVSPRSWQHWEAGKYQVPDDVAEKINDLADRRLTMIETCDDLMNEHDLVSDFEYDLSFDQYRSRHAEASVIDWRLSQSVSAYFLGERIATVK